MSNMFIFAALGGALTYLIYRFLNWQPIMWLSALIVVACGVAFLLDANANLIGILPVFGSNFFARGESQSLLGESMQYWVLGICWGVLLFVTALIKRHKTSTTANQLPKIIPVANTQLQIIRNELHDEIEIVNGKIGDAVDAGRADATEVGGPCPDRYAKAPPEGRFEATARERFMVLGNSFVGETIERLEQVITNALNALSTTKQMVMQQSYKEIAKGHYDQHAQQINDFSVKQIKKKFGSTQMAKASFEGTLKLRPAEQPNWAKRTSLKQLIVLGVFFTLVEFVVSYWFLKDGVGVEGAQQLAAIAIAVIMICAFAAGVLFQFMRHNIPPIYRVLSSVAYISVWVVVIGAIGSILSLRDATSRESDANLFETVIQSYAGILNDTNNLVVLLVNCVALVFFYWKVLHWCEKFHGFDEVNNAAAQAVEDHDGLFEQNATDIKAAIEKAKRESNNNRDSAKKHCDDIIDATTRLKGIKQIISNEYTTSVHPAFNAKINDYRQSNRAKRVIAVNPEPQYFQEGVQLCAVEEHFLDSHESDKFWDKNQGKIDESTDVKNEIVSKSLEWDAENAKFNSKLSREFQAQIKGI